MRKTVVTLTACLLTLQASISLVAEENENLKKLLEFLSNREKAKTEEEITQASYDARAYLGSLGPSEILKLGSAYAKWAEDNVSADKWDRLDGPRGLLYALLFTYVEKSGIEEVNPLISVISDKKENVRWRHSVIWYTGLDAFDSRISNVQQQLLIKALDSLQRDKEETAMLRGESCRRLSEVLRMVYDGVLHGDQSVKELLAKTPKANLYDHLKRDLQLKPTTRKKLKQIIELAHSHVDFMRMILKERSLDPYLTDGVKNALVGYNKSAIRLGKEQEIKEAMRVVEDLGKGKKEDVSASSGTRQAEPLPGPSSPERP